MRTIMILIAILFYSNNLLAQTNFYKGTKVFNETDYVYQCKQSSIGYVILHNKENKLTCNDLKFRLTGERFIPEDENMELLTDEGWLTYKRFFYEIMRYAFSEAELSVLRESDYDLYVDMFINTETGKVDEVEFSFSKDSGFVFIPISVYRNIELQIKEKCRFGITEEGKMLNYIYYWDTFELD